MNAPDTKNPSETDWVRVDAMSDEEVDTSDSPLLDEAFFERAELRATLARPVQSVALQIDAEVLAWFQAQGDAEGRINAALRLYAEAHKRAG